MTIYIDNNYKCYSVNDGTRREFNVSFFDGKCRAFIEGYRYIPQGESWTDKYGFTYLGESITPWKEYNVLAEAQKNYEDGQMDILSFVEQQLGVGL